MANLNYDKVPVPYMADAVRQYIENRIPPGHFLTAVICNNLKEAFARADGSNSAAVHDWVRWFYNEAPSGCWGSPDAMRDWLQTAEAA